MKILFIFIAVLGFSFEISKADQLNTIDLEQWNAVVLVRITDNEPKFFYIKKSDLNQDNEKILLENLAKPLLKMVKPISKVFGIKLDDTGIKTSVSLSLTEEEANSLQRIIKSLSLDLSKIPAEE